MSPNKFWNKQISANHKKGSFLFDQTDNFKIS